LGGKVLKKRLCAWRRARKRAVLARTAQVKQCWATDSRAATATTPAATTDGGSLCRRMNVRARGYLTSCGGGCGRKKTISESQFKCRQGEEARGRIGRAAGLIRKRPSVRDGKSIGQPVNFRPRWRKASSRCFAAFRVVAHDLPVAGTQQLVVPETCSVRIAFSMAARAGQLHL